MSWVGAILPVRPRQAYVVGLFGLTLGLALISQLMGQGQPRVDLELTTPQPVASLEVRSLPNPTPYIWWEAEDADQTNFPDRHAFLPDNAEEAAVLSGGTWVGVDGDRPQPLFLEYQVNVPPRTDAGTEYYFYSRKFWKHGPFRWRWDDQPWQSVDRAVFLMDSSPLRAQVVANWVPLGQVRLGGGTHTLRVELTSNEGAAAFDCFVLTQTPMQARGSLKPDQRYGAEIPGWFVFDPDANPFAESVLDLRSLNEPMAGSNGWIEVQGEAFVHQVNGEAVRFWGINTGPDVLTMDDATMAQAARFFARNGINMVRFHGRITPPDQLSLDGRSRDRLLAWVEALKQEGIYTSLSLYFPLWYRFPELGYADDNPFGVMFWNASLQQQYRDLWRDLLQSPLPSTGQPLGQDPALAFVELINEDSLFFWTFDLGRIPPQHQADLEQQFGRWLAARHGSIEAAVARWQGDRPEDRPEDLQEILRGGDRVALLSAWALAAQSDQLRTQDTAAFLGDRQRQFFEQTQQYLKQDLGYRGLVTASNWITADDRRLGPLDKYTNTVGDFMDRHGYFGGKHEGPAASYALTAGDLYQDQSALLLRSDARNETRPLSLPILDVHYNDKPSTLSEVNWAMPNRFRADFPVLAAAYGSLQNTDGFFFFAANSPSWQAPLGKFSIASPVMMGQFPATAWIYRQGLLQPGRAIATLERPVADILALQGIPLANAQNLDALRAADVPGAVNPSPGSAQTLDPMASLVGQVNVRFTDGQSRTDLPDLTPFHDRQQRQIRSSTGELTWDYDDGLVTLNAPQVQGATGFLDHAGRIPLGALTLESSMAYGSILLVSFDGQPLDRSQKMLLQVMSADENFGWRTEGTLDKRLLSTGTAPLVVQNLAGTVALNRPDASRLQVTPLDSNGQAMGDRQSAQTIQLQPTVFYYWITADPA